MIMVCPGCGRAYWGPSCVTCTPPSSPEKLRAKARRWRRKNRAHVRARDKIYQIKRAEKHEATIKVWKAENKDKTREYCRAYRSRNLDKVRAADRLYQAKRRARKALEAAAQAEPPKPSPVADRLLKLAEVRAKVGDPQAQYGIKRISFQEKR